MAAPSDWVSRPICTTSVRLRERLTLRGYLMMCTDRVDPNTPIEVTVKAMEECRREGKCKYLGLSECGADTLRRACKVAQIHAYQVECAQERCSVMALT
jgi:aryl-alcohol dehydrogenase-like predicted oxidoreductase